MNGPVDDIDHAAGGWARGLEMLASRTFAERSPERLRAGLRNGCWIYGAGGYGRAIGALLAARGFDVRGYIDRRGGDPALAGLGLPVVRPEDIAAEGIAGRAIVVALHNFAADQLPVVRWARATGFAEVLVPAELPDLLGPEAGSYWLAGRGHAAEHLDELETIAALLADDRSVATLAALARFRISGEIEAHPPSFLADQYFPADLPLPPGPLRLVDGGAYIGDALEAVEQAGRSIGEWYAFEPDPANFTVLASRVAASGVARAALFPCGLGDRAKQLRFATGGADGSHASDSGDAVIQVVALDEVLHGIDPTFVKLDIEGAEAEALDGMAATLARSRPRVAMSIYHKPADLWELPLKLHALLPDAKLHIRQHGFNGFDTVLYAIP